MKIGEFLYLQFCLETYYYMQCYKNCVPRVSVSPKNGPDHP